MIRLPINQPTRMTIGISDESGAILALYRMPDGTVFSLGRRDDEGAQRLLLQHARRLRGPARRRAQRAYERYTWEPEPPAGKGWAVTARTISFGGQPLFPPGIDLEEQLERTTPSAARAVVRSLRLRLEESLHRRARARRAAATAAYLNQSGIVWFPGSVPLYRGDRVIGGLGVSGDGVEQDDYVSLLGSEGFHPPDSLRVDNSVITERRRDSAVRLPYLKYPRTPNSISKTRSVRSGRWRCLPSSIARHHRLLLRIVPRRFRR